MADISCIFSAFLAGFPSLLSLLVLWLSLILLTLRFRLIILWLVLFGLDLVRLWWLVGLKILAILWILGGLLERILLVLLCISTGLISVPFFLGSLVDRGFERIENLLVGQERGDEQELAEQEQLGGQQRVEQRVEDQQAHY